jgi:hypothetical protein
LRENILLFAKRRIRRVETNDAADIIAELQDLKAEVISELQDVNMLKILSIYCVMTRIPLVESCTRIG